MIMVCMACWAGSALFVESWHQQFPNVRLLPLTQLVLVPHGWLLFAPIPWIVYAGILSFRKQLATNAVLLFIGTICFAIFFIVSLVTLAVLLPHMGRIMTL